MAQAQRRFSEAEEHYRQALDIYLEFDDRLGAASIYHQFGTMLADLARHAEAVAALLHAAVAWRESTKSWPPETLGLLKRERAQVTGDTFQATVRTVVPHDLVNDLTAAVDDAEAS